MAGKGFAGRTCAYCGDATNRTIAEHVFGKKHFLIRHRGNLPKVAGCEACNTAKSQLENYAMAAFPLGANDPGAKEFADENVERRLEKNLRLRTTIVQSMEVIQSPEGDRLAYGVDATKLLELLMMVTRGLFAWHFGRPLHRNWEPRVRHLATTEEAEAARTIDALVWPNPEVVHRNLGEGTFEYWGQRSRRHPYCSGWRFKVYGIEMAGGPDERDATFSTIACATMRRV